MTCIYIYIYIYIFSCHVPCNLHAFQKNISDTANKHCLLKQQVYCYNETLVAKLRGCIWFLFLDFSRIAQFYTAKFLDSFLQYRMKIYALRVCNPSGQYSVAFHTFIWEVPSSNAYCPLFRFVLIILCRRVNIFVICSHGPLSPISNSYIQFTSIFCLYYSVLCNNSSFNRIDRSKCVGKSLQEDKGRRNFL